MFAPCPEPDGHAAALAHAHGADAVFIDLMLCFENLGRNVRILKHPAKDPCMGILSAFSKVSALDLILFLVKRLLAKEVQAEGYEALAGSKFVGKERLASVGRDPEEGRQFRARNGGRGIWNGELGRG